jgi:hypothetical protein
MAQSSFMNVLNYGVLQGHWFSSGSPSRTIGNFGQQGNPFCGYNRNVKCQLCYEYGHTAQQCSRLATHPLQANANLVFNNAFTTTLVTWFPDTGGNHHVTPDLVSMTSSKPYLGNDHLHVGDGCRTLPRARRRGDPSS